MKQLSKYFLRGLLTFMPFAATIYVFFVLILWSEKLTGLILSVLGLEIHIPGLGMVVAVGLIVSFGFVVSLPVLDKVLGFIELPFKNVPLVKSIYSAVKSLSDYFSPSEDGASQQVVMVSYPGSEVELVGFLTRDNVTQMGLGIQDDQKVAVYFPLSYQIGGYTCFIPRAWVRKLDISVESAMGQSLTAWMPAKKS